MGREPIFEGIFQFRQKMQKKIERRKAAMIERGTKERGNDGTGYNGKGERLEGYYLDPIQKPGNRWIAHFSRKVVGCGKVFQPPSRFGGRFRPNQAE